MQAQMIDTDLLGGLVDIVIGVATLKGTHSHLKTVKFGSFIFFTFSYVCVTASICSSMGRAKHCIG